MTTLDAEDVQTRIAAWARESFGSLERVVFEGRLLFKDVIITDKASKDPPRPVMVEPLSLLDRARARAEAVKVCDEHKIQRERDPDLWDAIDGMAVLAHAIRDPTEPYGQHRGLANMIQTYGKIPGCLERMADRLRVAEQLADPRVPALTEDMCWTLVEAIREKGHLGPLVGMPAYDQNAFALFMADRLSTYRRESYSKS